MQFRSLFNAALALLLAFSCYPVSCVLAYADEMEELDDRGYESSSGMRPGGGQPLGSSSVHSPLAGIDDLPSDNFGDNGDSANSSKGLVSKVSEDFGESQSIQDYQYGYGDSSSGELPSSDYLAGNGLASSPDSNYGDDGSFTSSDDLASPRVAPAVLLGWAATALGAAASVTGILSSLNDLFGSPSGSSMTRTEALLSSILGWQYELSNDIGSNNIRLLNLYNLINQMYTNDIKGIYSLISHIGTNTELFKTNLKTIQNYLYATNADGYSITHWVAGIFNYVKPITTYLSNFTNYFYAKDSNGYGLVHWVAGIFNYVKPLRTDVLSIYNALYATQDSAVNSNSITAWVVYLFNEVKAQGAELSTIRSYLYAANSDSYSVSGWVAGIWTRTDDLRRNSTSLLALLSEYLPELSSPNISVSGGGLTDNQLGALLASIDRVGDLLLIAGAKDLVETIVGDFNEIVNPVTTSAIESALQSAFPFCIPAIVKQLLGLLEADPVPPSFEFEVGGQALVLDASQVQGFADLLSWACRFLFLLGLLISTPRFIYKEVAA